MRGSRALPILAVFALSPLHSACGVEGSRADTSDAFSSRDSAGITIVESAAPAWGDGAGWRLSSEPVLRIGSLDGPPEEQLFQAVGVRRLPDGGIIVANAGSHEIRWYGPEGNLRRSVGREGDGPGEFRRIGSFFRMPGDSLLVWDIGARRASVFDAEGSFGRSFQLPELEFPRISTLQGVLADGRLVVGTATVLGPGGREGAQRDTLLLMLHPGTGAELDTLWSGPGSEHFVSTQGGGVRVTALLFGRATHVAVAGDRFLIGDTDRYEIRTLSPDGAVERILRRAHGPRRVQTAHVEQAIAERLDAMPDPSFRARFGEMFERMPLPASFPAFATFRVSTAGHLWVQGYPIPGTRPFWEVFDPEGRLLGPVSVPDGFHALEIGEDYVLGLRRDELEVEHVELYAVEKPGP